MITKYVVDGEERDIKPNLGASYTELRYVNCEVVFEQWSPNDVEPIDNTIKIELDWRINQIETMSTTSEDRFSWSPKHSEFIDYMQILYAYDGTGERPIYE